MYTQAIEIREMPRSERSDSDPAKLSTILKNTGKLSSSCGGRTWLDVTMAEGSTFYMLLPIPVNNSSADE